MGIENKKTKKIREMIKEGKGNNEISKTYHVSFSTIKKIRDAMKRKDYHNQVISMLKKGNTYEEISVELDLDLPEIKNMVSRHIVTTTGAWLGTFYQSLVNSNIDPEKFLTLCSHLYEKNIGIKELQELISIKENLPIYRKKRDDLLDFSNNLRKQNSSLENEISEKEMIISEKEMIIQDMDKTINSKQTKIDQLDVEINRKQVKLDKVNELDNKIKKDPRNVKLKEQFLENLGFDKFVFRIADGLVEILFELMRPSSLSFREQNHYYNIYQIPNFETFRKVLPHLYQELLSIISKIIRRHTTVEKRFLHLI